jgi:hypothetical protein
LVGMVKLIKYNEEVVCRDGCRLEDNWVLRRDMRILGP